MTKKEPVFDLDRCFITADRFAKATLTLSSKITTRPDNPRQLDLNIIMPSIVFNYQNGVPTHALYGEAFAGFRKEDCDGDFVDPYVVNGALSIELYLKCLYYISTKKIPKWQHLLGTLFGDLPQDVQQRVLRRFDATLEPKGKYQFYAVNFRKIAPDFAWDLVLILSKSANAFVHYRYPHDTPPTSWFVGFRELRAALRGEIVSLWKKTMPATPPP